MAAGRVAWFTDPHCADRSITGGKGASLARLAMAGLPVPEGFVVTSQALTADAAVEPTLAAEVSDAYSRLGAGPVAVRSSACAEDSDNASFAGQHETYLNVRGEAEVVAAVGRCWASVFSERAVFYRDRKGSPDDVRMAVVIQRQLNPAKSGVMFTMDPVQRRRDRMVVEAVWGLGEAVVSGKVTPDHYVIDRTGIALHMHISLQPLLIESLETGGTVERPVAPEIGGARVLTDEDLIALADMGHRLEAIFGGPQDVEWAIQDGQLYLLQSRPVTA